MKLCSTFQLGMSPNFLDFDFKFQNNNLELNFLWRVDESLSERFDTQVIACHFHVP
jgi:hypothetical protein